MDEIRKQYLPELNTKPNPAVLGKLWMMLYKSPSALVMELTIFLQSVLLSDLSWEDLSMYDDILQKCKIYR